MFPLRRGRRRVSGATPPRDAPSGAVAGADQGPLVGPCAHVCWRRRHIKQQLRGLIQANL
eukprot:4250776-Alexandrium_andersonii.AAC.1